MSVHEDTVLKLLVEMQGDLGGVKAVTSQILDEAKRTNGRISSHDREIAELKKALAIDEHDDRNAEASRARREQFKGLMLTLGVMILVGVVGAGAALLAAVH